MVDIGKIKAESLKNLENAIGAHTALVETVAFWQPVLEKMPELEGYVSSNFYPNYSSYTYYPTSSEEAEKIRSAIQVATGEIARRDLTSIMVRLLIFSKF
jgi:hypothetical protein